MKLEKINIVSFICLFMMMVNQSFSQNLYWSLGGTYSSFGRHHFTWANISSDNSFIVNTDYCCNYKFYDLITGNHFKTITDTSTYYSAGDFLIYDNNKYLISYNLNVIDINNSQIIRQLERPTLDNNWQIQQFIDMQVCNINGKETIIGLVGSFNSSLGILIFWDFETGKVNNIYKELYKDSRIESFNVTTDNKILLNYSRFIVLYNPTANIIEKEIKPDPKYDQTVKYSNNIISSVSSDYYDEIKLYDYPGLSLIGSINITDISSMNYEMNFDVSQDGSKVLYKVGSQIGIANTKSKKEMFKFKPKTFVENSVFVNNNSILTSRGGFELMLYNFNEKGIIKSLPIAPVDWNFVLATIILDNPAKYQIGLCPGEIQVRMFNGGCFRHIQGFKMDENGEIYWCDYFEPCDMEGLASCRQYFTACLQFTQGQYVVVVTAGPVQTLFTYVDPYGDCQRLCE